MEDQRRLIWDEKAFLNFEESLEWISKRSIPTAEEVEKALFEKINTIRSYPERHPPDKYKKGNSGNYRAFESHGYRVSYRYTENEVRIVYFRHVRQYPRKY
jgi:mRNA-degrading endonuclease RelE of RelBE toxin-antitoxin system